MKIRQKIAGVSLVELLLVIGLISLLMAVAAPFLSNFVLRNNTEVTKEKVLGAIRKAQSYAMDGKNNQVWGVCLSGDDIRLYSGSCASPFFSEDFDVPSTITLSGLSDHSFNDRGEPSAAINIAVESDIASETISMNGAGGLLVDAGVVSPFPTHTPTVTPGGPTNTPTPTPVSPTNTPTPINTATPTPLPPTNTPTPVPTATATPVPPTNTPTPAPINSCADYCVSLGGYSTGTCRQNAAKCPQNGEIYEFGGDSYCTGGASADSCCCD